MSNAVDWICGGAMGGLLGPAAGFDLFISPASEARFERIVDLASAGGRGNGFKISDLRFKIGSRRGAIACGGTAEEKTGNVKLRANQGEGGV